MYALRRLKIFLENRSFSFHLALISIRVVDAWILRVAVASVVQVSLNAERRLVQAADSIRLQAAENDVEQPKENEEGHASLANGRSSTKLAAEGTATEDDEENASNGTADENNDREAERSGKLEV